LIHWEDWPVALWPDTPQDRADVYSGNTFVDDDGALCALYTGNVADHRKTYGILARSTDGGVTWRKRVVMDNAQRPNADSPVHWDGFVWRDGDRWQQLIGGTTGGTNRQGAAWLWTSTDLEHWTLQKNIAPTIRHGTFWELPYLVPLAGQHVLFVGAGNNPYWVGQYDTATLAFTPNDTKPRTVDTGHYYSFNLNMTDDKGPGGTRRQLMHGWVTGPSTPTKSVPYWQGAHSVPRVLRLVDNRLWQEPVPELVQLRGKRFGSDEPIRGDALDITATFIPDNARQFGVKVRVSADGQEFTRVFFDTASRRFGVDGPNAEKLKDVRASGSQESFLSPGAPVTMRILLDRSIVEVFVNGVAYTARTFPPAAALGVESFSEGGSAAIKSLEIYELQSAW
jgi:beta-fructofuranosidase